MRLAGEVSRVGEDHECVDAVEDADRVNAAADPGEHNLDGYEDRDGERHQNTPLAKPDGNGAASLPVLVSHGAACGLVVRVGVFAALAAVLFASAGSAAPPLRSEARGQRAAGAGWRVERSPFRVVFTHGGRVVVGETPAGAGSGSSLAYEVVGGGFHTLGDLVGEREEGASVAYTVTTDEPGRTALVSVGGSAHDLRVDVSFSPGAVVKRVFETLQGSPREHFLGGGMRRDTVDVHGRFVTGKVYYQCGNSVVAPFVATSSGYGLYVTTAGIARIALPGRSSANGTCDRDQTPPCPLTPSLSTVQLCVKASSLSYRLYLGSPAQVLEAYTMTSGRASLPPPSQFALMKWRDIVSGPGDVLNDIRELRSRRIPIGWVIIDNPWEAGDCNGSLQFGDSRYPPDPRPMLEAIHRQHVLAMIWVSPLVTRDDPRCPHPDYPDSSLLGHGKQAEIDLSNPAAAATFEQKLSELFASGFDGVKGDRGDELDLESRTVSSGTGGELQNNYPLLYATIVTRALRQFRGKNFATLFRAGYAGSQALVYGVSAGDLEGSFAGLQAAIRATESAGVSGFPFVGADVGGYSNAQPPLTAELFLRWAQFAAVTPIFEVGGQGESSHFWDFGTTTVSLFRDAATLHYELFPYLYELAVLAHRTGLPIVRPLALAYPNDPAAWSADLEFLVGPNLLAAPVTEAASSRSDLTGPPTLSPVYLPAGDWVDLFGGTVLHGPQRLVRPTPISQFPLYLRRGTALPFNLREPLIWSKPWLRDALTQPGRIGWLVAPAQGPTATAHTRSDAIRAREQDTVVSVAVSGNDRERQVLVLNHATPCQVTIAGHAVNQSPTAVTLRRRVSGWLTTTGAFAGTLLKLPPGDAVHASIHNCR